MDDDSFSILLQRIAPTIQRHEKSAGMTFQH